MGSKDLEIISNNTSVKGRGIGLLVHENRIKHITCSHIGSNTETVEKVINGELSVTFVPQGTLCERVRAGGAGIGGILTPWASERPLPKASRLLRWMASGVSPGKPIRANVALIHAWKADKMGNVVYRRTARNFNQVFATSADWVIVEAEHIVEVGELDPDEIMTPGALVDAVVQA